MKPVPGAERLGTAALKSGSRRVLDKNWQGAVTDGKFKGILCQIP